jgi:RNA polymerase sigma-70 factor (ECF subfamily)
MERAIADLGGPAGESEGRLHSLHCVPKPSAPFLPLSRQTAGRPSRRSPVTLQPHGTPAADDPVAGWVRQIQDGVDVERNFELLYKRFYPPLFASFRRQRLPPEECEELAQDALFNAFNKIATFEHRSRFSTWLWEIVRNLYLNDRRRRTTAKRDGVELPLAESLTSEDESAGGVVLEATEPSPYEEAERKEQLTALRDALSSLPPKMQRCAVLRFQDNLKYREIATLMRLNIDTVKAHLGHARQVLHEKLGPQAGRFTRPGREDEP